VLVVMLHLRKVSDIIFFECTEANAMSLSQDFSFVLGRPSTNLDAFDAEIL
jgi:hypothetical protein